MAFADDEKNTDQMEKREGVIYSSGLSIAFGRASLPHGSSGEYDDEFDRVIDGYGYTWDESFMWVHAFQVGDPTKSIGTLELTEDEEYGGIWLDSIEVDDAFRRKGIGTNLLRLAMEELCNDFYIASVQNSSAYKYSLTADGYHLVQACLRKSILNEDQFKRKDIPLEGGREDPGLGL